VCPFKADHDFILCTLGNKGELSQNLPINAIEPSGFNMKNRLAIIGFLMCISSIQGYANDNSWIQNIRDQIDITEQAKSDNIDVENTYRLWPTAVKDAQLAKASYYSALNRVAQAQDRIKGRLIFHDLDQATVLYSNKALIGVWRCKNKAWTEMNITKNEATMLRTPAQELVRVNRRISGVNTAISCFVDLQNALWERFKIKWHFNNYPGSVDDDLMVFAELLRLRRKDHPSAITSLNHVTNFINNIEKYIPNIVYDVWEGWNNNDSMGYRYTAACDDNKIKKVFIVMDGISGLSHWSEVNDLSSGDMAWPLQREVDDCGMVMLPLSIRYVNDGGVVSREWGFDLSPGSQSTVNMVKSIINTIGLGVKVYLMKGTDYGHTAELVLDSLKKDDNVNHIAGLITIDKDTEISTIIVNRYFGDKLYSECIAEELREDLIYYDLKRIIKKE
jgi:hypothetical protein